MKIDSICISCYKGDFYLTRILVASIRFWYPDVEILLIKDKHRGDFDTCELEAAWNVKLFPTPRSVFGQGFGKLEPLFLPPGRRFLVLDSDVVFLGPLLSKLESYSEEFVVQEEKCETLEWIAQHYFDLAKLSKLEPAFQFPGITFNTGQMVVSSGILKYSDFEPFVSGSPPMIRRRDVFKLGEQGLLVYMILKGVNEKRFKIARTPMMLWPPSDEVANLQLDQILADSPYCSLLHWCGMRQLRLEKMIRGDLLKHFEKLYYTKVAGGGIKRKYRGWARVVHGFARHWRSVVSGLICGAKK